MSSLVSRPGSSCLRWAPGNVNPSARSPACAPALSLGRAVGLVQAPSRTGHRIPVWPSPGQRPGGRHHATDHEHPCSPSQPIRTPPGDLGDRQRLARARPGLSQVDTRRARVTALVAAEPAAPGGGRRHGRSVAAACAAPPRAAPAGIGAGLSVMTESGMRGVAATSDEGRVWAHRRAPVRPRRRALHGRVRLPTAGPGSQPGHGRRNGALGRAVLRQRPPQRGGPGGLRCFPLQIGARPGLGSSISTATGRAHCRPKSSPRR